MDNSRLNGTMAHARQIGQAGMAMEIVTFVPRGFEDLAQTILLPSLRAAEPNAKVHVFGTEDLEMSSKDSQWLIYSEIVKSSLGKSLFFTSCNVYYHSPFLSLLSRHAPEAEICPSTTMLGGPPGPDQLLVRCTMRVAEFFESLTDQEPQAFAQKLESSGIPFSYLSYRFSSAGIWQTLTEPERRQCVSFVDSTASCAESKMRSLLAARAFLQRGRPPLNRDRLKTRGDSLPVRTTTGKSGPQNLGIP